MVKPLAWGYIQIISNRKDTGTNYQNGNRQKWVSAVPLAEPKSGMLGSMSPCARTQVGPRDPSRC